jgi:hypothetical protein
VSTHDHVWQTWDEVNEGRGGVFHVPDFTLKVPAGRTGNDVLMEYLRYCACGRVKVLDGPLREDRT